VVSGFITELVLTTATAGNPVPYRQDVSEAENGQPWRTNTRLGASWTYAHTTDGLFSGSPTLPNSYSNSGWRTEPSSLLQNWRLPFKRQKKLSVLSVLLLLLLLLLSGMEFFPNTGRTERILAYYSRSLNKTERNYWVTWRELLAVEGHWNLSLRTRADKSSTCSPTTTH
jgi:hypothetical protein